MPDKQFTRKEIADWQKKDTVFVIDNVVYDVTQFLDEHPGGHEVLANVAGTDASEEFHDIGHSLDAKELMHKYVIGEIVDEEKVALPKRKNSWQVTTAETESSFLSSWKFPVLMGIVLTVLYTYLFG